MIFVGVDWAEAHHEVCVLDGEGAVVARTRVVEGPDGLEKLHGLLARHVDEPDQVIVGIETDRGLLVGSLVAAGYEIYAINPLSVARYRDRHGTSRAKSDAQDAKLLADIVRTDRHNHRQVAGDSELAEAIKVIARAHKNAIWARQRQVNTLRSALREYYPAALAAFSTDLASKEALAVLAIAPTPSLARELSLAQIASALRSGGRVRGADKKAAEIRAVLQDRHLEAPDGLSRAYGAVTASAVQILRAYNGEIDALKAELTEHFDKHPDAKVIRSLPGLGTTLGARVLGEFGDDRTRYVDTHSRKNFAGTSPIEVSSGKLHTVTARHVRGRRLADACDRWALCSITASPEARRYYDELRTRNKTHPQALRQLANRWVGILHGCLETGTFYDAHIAWRRFESEGLDT
jgi:transposase